MAVIRNCRISRLIQQQQMANQQFRAVQRRGQKPTQPFDARRVDMKLRYSSAAKLFSILSTLLLSLAVSAQDLGGGMWHTLKNGQNPWAPFVDVRGEAGYPAQFVDVSIAEDPNGYLHVLGSGYDGSLWHTIRYPNGYWLQFDDVTADTGQPGHIDAIATAFSGNTLHLVVQSYGRLWYAARKANAAWTKFQAVAPAWKPEVVGLMDADSAGLMDAEAALPYFRDISISVNQNGEIHILAVAGDGNLLHTSRQTNGRWEKFENVSAQAGLGDGGAVASAFIGNELHVILGTNLEGKLMYTARDRNDGWSKFIDVMPEFPGKMGDVSIVGDAVSGDLHVVAIAREAVFDHAPPYDGPWYVTRSGADGKWSFFSDVGAEAGLCGCLGALSAAMVADNLHVTTVTVPCLE